MSRIGEKPIPVPESVTVSTRDGVISVKGPKGELSEKINPMTEVSYDDENRLLTVTRKGNSRNARALHGLQRALINNMVVGVTEGYTIGMELHGTGYTAEVKGKELVLGVGYAVPGVLAIPDGISVEVQQRAAQPNNPAKFTVSGVNKQQVGQFAVNVKRIKPPEPYQGKGIRYAGEQIRRKEGKAVVGGG